MYTGPVFTRDIPADKSATIYQIVAYIYITTDGHVVFVLIVHVAHWLMFFAVTSMSDHTTKQ